LSSYVTDTQALIKFMMGRKVINDFCHKIFMDADKGKNIIIIPAIVLMEIMYLFEKKRIPVNLLETEELLQSSNYQVEPLGLEIIKAATEIKDIPELHDRLIAATARYLDVPIITNDPEISKSRFIRSLPGV
jgi:predicted nucleic acid-binding protein